MRSRFRTIDVRIRETKGGELRKMQRRGMKGKDKIKI